MGILFDLDGTLLDTAPDFALCLNQILQENHQEPITIAAMREHVSFGVRGMLNFGFQSSLTEEQLQTHTERFLSLYDQHLGERTEPFPGIIDLLSWIEQQQIPWGIVTNKPSRFAQPLIQQFAVMSDAQCLICGDTLPVRKPDPAPLLAACSDLKLTPQSTWYVGDALADIEASRQAGLRCAIAQYGYIPTAIDLNSWQADKLFTDPLDLKGLF